MINDGHHISEEKIAKVVVLNLLNKLYGFMKKHII